MVQLVPNNTSFQNFEKYSIVECVPRSTANVKAIWSLFSGFIFAQAKSKETKLTLNLFWVEKIEERPNLTWIIYLKLCSFLSEHCCIN